MENYKLKLVLKSPALIGSGLGYGALIDSDVVFDEIGIPYIPSKRIKGCLRNSVEEIKKILECASINFELPTISLFGNPGSDQPTPVYFSNLYPEYYESNRAWLNYFLNRQDCKNIISKELIVEAFTQIRQQTAIDEEGMADDHSLRTIRVLRRGYMFIGDIHIQFPTQTILNTLNLAVMNFRCFGTKRNRGFGEIECNLLDKNLNPIPFPKDLEDLCTA